MDTIKINKKDTLLIAHRGLSGIERENTCASFIAAGNRSHYGIETDIHLTKDNIFVISHDANTKRVSPFTQEIKDTNYQDLQKIDYYELNTTTTKPYIKMPTLKEYLEICEKYNKHSVIEIKPLFKVSEIKRLLKEIKEIRKLDDVTIIAFDLRNLLRLRKLDETIKIQYLASKYTDELLDICKTNNFGIDIHYGALTPSVIKNFKDSGIIINAWTVNDKDVAKSLIESGVDFITTNILE